MRLTDTVIGILAQDDAADLLGRCELEGSKQMFMLWEDGVLATFGFEESIEVLPNCPRDSRFQMSAPWCGNAIDEGHEGKSPRGRALASGSFALSVSLHASQGF